MGLFIVILLIVILILLLKINSKLTARDYVREALKRDEDRKPSERRH
ncbi:hypothetical protein M6D81_01750 [Paenibacillus sp. J5C_2022]|nr:hypothetical protein [Paenibacillus sp. J5C2022]MCU6707420.1 hypothetical protein [Paenibacillus sp. J5C2022]